jgi:hypothetical protein
MIRVFVRKPDVGDFCKSIIPEGSGRNQSPTIVKSAAFEPRVTNQMNAIMYHAYRGVVYKFNYHVLVSGSSDLEIHS